jgi:phosphatidate cytidylyltransferase
VVGAGFLACLFGFCISEIFTVEINLVVYCTIVGTVGAVFASFGDLAASSIKRLTSIKDFGKIFPGHGGVLDRFDSVLFAAPMMYMTLILLFQVI